MVDLKKPRIRKVETVRERTTKHVSVQNKPKRHGVVTSLVLALLRPLSFLKGPLAIIFKPIRFIGRLLVPRYIRNSINELKQVDWPSRRQTWKLTFAVLIFATIFGALVVITDYGLDKVIRRIILR